MSVFSNSLESVGSPASKCTEDPSLVLPYPESMTSSTVSVLGVAWTELQETQTEEEE